MIRCVTAYHPFTRPDQQRSLLLYLLLLLLYLLLISLLLVAVRLLLLMIVQLVQHSGDAMVHPYVYTVQSNTS